MDFCPAKVKLGLGKPGQSLPVSRRRGCRALGVNLLLLERDRERIQLRPPLGFGASQIHAVLCFLNHRPCFVDRDSIVGRIDDEQQIALVNILIVGNIELNDTPWRVEEGRISGSS
jgi:hypothetical protein